MSHDFLFPPSFTLPLIFLLRLPFSPLCFPRHSLFIPLAHLLPHCGFPMSRFPLPLRPQTTSHSAVHDDALFPVGVKPGSRPGGTPGGPAGQTGADGESVFSKILPGGAAEQAGKLTEGMGCLGLGPHEVGASLGKCGSWNDSRSCHQTQPTCWYPVIFR